MEHGEGVIYTLPGYTGYGYRYYDESSDEGDGWYEEAEESDELDKFALLSDDDAYHQVYTNS